MAAGKQLSDNNGSGTALGQSATDMGQGIVYGGERITPLRGDGRENAAISGWFLT